MRGLDEVIFSPRTAVTDVSPFPPTAAQPLPVPTRGLDPVGGRRAVLWQLRGCLQPWGHRCHPWCLLRLGGGFPFAWVFQCLPIRLGCRLLWLLRAELEVFYQGQVVFLPGHAVVPFPHPWHRSSLLSFSLFSSVKGRLVVVVTGVSGRSAMLWELVSGCQAFAVYTWLRPWPWHPARQPRPCLASPDNKGDDIAPSPPFAAVLSAWWGPNPDASWWVLSPTARMGPAAQRSLLYAVSACAKGPFHSCYCRKHLSCNGNPLALEDNAAAGGSWLTGGITINNPGYYFWLIGAVAMERCRWFCSCALNSVSVFWCLQRHSSFLLGNNLKGLGKDLVQSAGRGGFSVQVSHKYSIRQWTEGNLSPVS